jgi:MFS family permease
MLAVLLLGQFMCIIDVFIVNVAMPSIGASLHASGAALQLVVGGYTAAYAMLLITGARLGDLHGRRRVYLAGMALFTAASLACGLAPDGAALVAFRFAQGAGAAAAVPQIFSLIQMRFTGPARAKALSAYAVVLSSGAAAGLVAGGVIVTANLFGQSWRPVFWLNVPLGLALIIAARSLIPADEPTGPRGLPTGPRGLDLAGLGLAVPSILLVVLPLVLGSEAGWPAWAWCAIAAGLALAVLFTRIERKISDPLLNLEVLRAPGLGPGLAALGCTQIAYGGLLFTFTLHLREGLGDSALRAGLSYLPMAVTFGLAGLCWRRLPARFHRALPIAGTSLSALGYLALAVHGDLWTWGALAVIGTGLGLAASPLLTLSLRHVPPARAADASGVLTTAIQLAQLTGVAVLGAVFLAGARGRGAVHAAAAASGHAMTVVSWWMAALSAVGMLAAIALARTSR